MSALPNNIRAALDDYTKIVDSMITVSPSSIDFTATVNVTSFISNKLIGHVLRPELKRGVAWQKPVSFMIERSVIPLSNVLSSFIYYIFPSSTVLSSVDSKPIRTYRHCSTIVLVKTLRRANTVDFIVTDI